ncbi:unnamed protein product [Blepharisma stoltei]|uniref:Maturase K n=1 Tax=Blepharisma stoltei TaxID=1481888 RepID=A0AAU9J9H2_9CILI|nr:unnamed protein product [Blepharisma stoltei]
MLYVQKMSLARTSYIPKSYLSNHEMEFESIFYRSLLRRYKSPSNYRILFKNRLESDKALAGFLKILILQNAILYHLISIIDLLQNKLIWKEILS